jgi:hypothetical protein
VANAAFARPFGGFACAIPLRRKRSPEIIPTRLGFNLPVLLPESFWGTPSAITRLKTHGAMLSQQVA